MYINEVLQKHYCKKHIFQSLKIPEPFQYICLLFQRYFQRVVMILFDDQIVIFAKQNCKMQIQADLL